MRRIAFVLLAIIFAGSLSGGCSMVPVSPHKVVSDPVTVTIQLLADDDEFANWQDVFHVFNRSNPKIRVELDQILGNGYNEYAKKVTAEIASGTVPDIIRLNPSYFADFYRKGFLADLTSYIPGVDPGKYDLDAFGMDGTGGQLFGIPDGMNPLVLYYNKYLFDKANIPYPPADWGKAWDWRQFADASHRIAHGKGENRVYGAVLDVYGYGFSPFLWSNGGGVVDRRNPQVVTVDSPASREVLRSLADLYKAGDAPIPGKEPAAGAELFMTARAGMLIGGPELLPAFSHIYGFDWGVAPCVRMHADQPAATIDPVNRWALLQGAGHPQEAAKVLEFLMSDQAANLLVDYGLSGIPVQKQVRTKRRADLFKPLSEKEKDMLFTSLEVAQNPPAMPNEPLAEQDIEAAFAAMVAGQRSADETADELARTLRARFSKP